MQLAWGVSAEGASAPLSGVDKPQNHVCGSLQATRAGRRAPLATREPPRSTVPLQIKGLNHGTSWLLLDSGGEWVCARSPCLEREGDTIGPQNHGVERFYFKWWPNAHGVGGPLEGVWASQAWELVGVTVQGAPSGGGGSDSRSRAGCVPLWHLVS